MVVRVEPSGVVIDVDEGEALMAAAVRAGYRWPSICGGLAECGACVVEIIASAPDHRDADTLVEQQRLCTVPERRLRPGAALRLACQFRPGSADVTVFKRGVRPGP
jgi:2Fe-2S ferredoxin